MPKINILACSCHNVVSPCVPSTSSQVRDGGIFQPIYDLMASIPGCSGDKWGIELVTHIPAFRIPRPTAALLLAAALCACARDADVHIANSAPVPIVPLPVSPILPPPPRPVLPPPALSANVAMLARGFEGRVGIAIKSIDQGWCVDSSGDRRPAPAKREQIMGRDDRARFPRCRAPEARRPGDAQARGPHAVPPADRSPHQGRAGLSDDGRRTAPARADDERQYRQ